MKASELKPGQMFRFTEEGSSTVAVYVCIQVLMGVLASSAQDRVWCIRISPKEQADFTLLWCTPSAPVSVILAFHEGEYPDARASR